MDKIKAKLQNSQGITLVVVLMTMAILLSVIGAGLLFSGVNTKITANYQTGTRAFYAADTGVAAAVGQMSADPAVATAAFSVDMGNGLKYRSGNRTAGGAQPLQYVGTRPEAGFSLNVGTGYNASGYSFHQYQMNVTGTYTASGTELAGREIEAQAAFGPVAR